MLPLRISKLLHFKKSKVEYRFDKLPVSRISIKNSDLNSTWNFSKHKSESKRLIFTPWLGLLWLSLWFFPLICMSNCCWEGAPTCIKWITNIWLQGNDRKRMKSRKWCPGSVTFWYWLGCRSSDPLLRKTDPDADPYQNLQWLLGCKKSIFSYFLMF